MLVSTQLYNKKKSYLNTFQAHNDTAHKITNFVKPEHGSLETSTSKLEIISPSKRGIFVDGKMKLICEATLFSIYRRTNEVEIVDDTPQLAPVLGLTPALGNVLFMTYYTNNAPEGTKATQYDLTR